MKRSLIYVLIVGFFLLFRNLYAQEPVKFDMMWGVKAPMRDGVQLNATVFRPHDQKEPLPVILDITPYISDSYHARGKYFSQNGYVYVIVDCRGRGSSEGEFTPFVNEAKDGYDLVEWFAKQSYCNQKVTMWGGSYSGYNQWATVKEFPPHLTSVAPVATVYPGFDFPKAENIFTSYNMCWLTYTGGKTGNRNLFEDSDYWRTKYTDLYVNYLPFSQLDKLVGNESTVFQTWLQHPTYDAYWKSMSPTREEYQKVNLPILSITGHYDGDQKGTLEFYRNLMANASTEAKAKMYLIIGPYDHPGTRTPAPEFGGVKFGKESLLNLDDLHKQWYDYTLKGRERPKFLKDNVAYYVMGDEKWKYAKSLEAIANDHRVLYLNSTGGQAHDVFTSGSLDNVAPVQGAPDEFTYDPLNTKQALHQGKLRHGDNAYLKDQVRAFNLENSGVIYHSQPFADSTEISGVVNAKLFISSNVPDCDLVAALYEITANGQSIELTFQNIRLRYRESLEKESLMQPGKIYAVDLNNFQFFSRRIAAGSRLRLIVSVINSPYYEKNYGSGGDVAKESKASATKGTITLHHKKEYASYIQLPIVKP